MVLEVYLVTALNPYDGPVQHVTFALNDMRMTPLLISFITEMASQPADHDLVYDSLLVQSLIDPLAFEIASNNNLPQYLARRSKELGFTYSLDTVHGTKVEWPAQLVLNPLKMGSAIIKRHFMMFLCKAVCQITATIVPRPRLYRSIRCDEYDSFDDEDNDSPSPERYPDENAYA